MTTNNDEEVDNSGCNPFLLEDIYPDPSSLLSFQGKKVGEIKETALIVLDTNALLVPYNTGKESFASIQKVYEKLIKKERLFVPGRVIREFAKNRSLKLQELFQQVTRRSNINFTESRYPSLEDLEEYKTLLKSEDEIQSAIKGYQKSLSSLRSVISSWNSDDPVTHFYRKIFQTDRIIEIPLDKKEFLKELNYRYLNKIPPGYKDQAKNDGGLGDLIIWKTILDLGRQKKMDVIFVSGDEKADWWYRSENVPLYVRTELIEEYRQASEGKTFHILSLSKLLEIFGADDQVVQEVAQELSFNLMRMKKPARFPIFSPAQSSVIDWILTLPQVVSLTDQALMADYIITTSDNKRIALELKFMSGRSPTAYFRKNLDVLYSLTEQSINNGLLAEIWVVFIAESYDGLENLEKFSLELTYGKRGLRRILGYLDSTESFIPNKILPPFEEDY